MASSHSEEEDATCNPYRARSISLPSRSHPLALRFQEELTTLKSWAQSHSSTTATAASPPSPANAHLLTGLQAVSRVYDAVQNLLRMPAVRRAVAADHARRDGFRVAGELDGSVRLLDACASARDTLGILKDAARGLQCALRTRAHKPCPAALQGHARDYAARRREAAREMARCVRELKAVVVVDEQMQGAGQVSAVSTGGGDQEELSLILGALRDARVMAAAVLRAVLSGYASKPPASRPAAGWGLVSKALLLKGKPAPASAAATADADADAVEASVQAMLHKTKTKQTGEADSLEAQRHLEALEAGVAGVETALECVFRRLVRNRADLLNIVNHV